jgi:AraC-like DNA-binding protein
MINLVDCIQQSIGFIEDHLHEPITVSDMADAAGYSIFHFIRSFNQVVCHTPYDYLMRRRLTKSAEDLVSSNRRIIDIAQDYCIGSQESFTRLFRRMFDETPGQCRAAGWVAGWKTFQAKTAEDLCFSSQLDPQSIVITNIETIRLKGLMSRVEEGLAKREKIRSALIADLSKMMTFKANYQLYEIWSGTTPEQTDEYCFLGTLMSGEDDGNGVLVDQTIPEGKVIEVGINQGDEISAVRFVLSSWMPNNELQPLLPLCLILRKDDHSNAKRWQTLIIKVEKTKSIKKTGRLVHE